MIIDGKKIAEKILDGIRLLPRPANFFGAVMIGKNEASKKFLFQKEKIAKTLGVDFRIYEFEEEIKMEEALEKIKEIVADPDCGALILQLPVPENLDKTYLMEAISKEKDPDVIGGEARRLFLEGKNNILPPAVQTVKTILKERSLNPKELSFGVVGKGFLVSGPIATWLSREAGQIEVFKRDSDLKNLKNFDVVISGTGAPGLIKEEFIKDGALVIDFGYGLENGKISGDFAPNPSPTTDNPRPISYTPTPGGTGPILVAELFRNFYKLEANKKDLP